MELFNITCLGKPLRLEGSLAGWQALYWNNQLVSQLAASADEGEKTHTFQLTADENIITVDVTSLINWQPFSIDYKVTVDGEVIESGTRNEKDIERQQPVVAPEGKQKFSLIGLASLGLKLLKSAKVVKVVLAGASVAAYSWLFSWQFALALIACLVVHEYGHIRAMKYFGMKTKGIYLIPFVGGAALSDEKINTRWQDVVISIMGPTFGLFMSLASMVAYWVTGNIFFAGLATFNALLNLFNLLPILPLDGGHILKSISFSMNSVVGLVACVAAAAVGVYISYAFGLALLGFLLLIGSAEILFEWKYRHHSHLLPLSRYGQIFSTVWYFSTVAALVGVIIYFATKGDDMLALPLLILQS
ncbi:site-2 protease family protein [Enterovibrio paralichthyis]|uniref:site-2 protease family protein n=1 Tax=Enterovibrio paralichthyis TaxID=2853805 RepID=UPI001C462ABB|nr:site-2 protease family protein [Enterovibrio paralichthyis]MBV7297427.1 site-2 protease family protein [Enterovibrio paralichthyis]